jgi:hypothetical protein
MDDEPERRCIRCGRELTHCELAAGNDLCTACAEDLDLDEDHAHGQHDD